MLSSTKPHSRVGLSSSSLFPLYTNVSVLSTMWKKTVLKTQLFFVCSLIHTKEGVYTGLYTGEPTLVHIYRTCSWLCSTSMELCIISMGSSCSPFWRPRGRPALSGSPGWLSRSPPARWAWSACTPSSWGLTVCPWSQRRYSTAAASSGTAPAAPAPARLQETHVEKRYCTELTDNGKCVVSNCKLRLIRVENYHG